jgi:4-amino-4-deoxy-L-arabinose transferase-like glycosyltransferase
MRAGWGLWRSANESMLNALELPDEQQYWSMAEHFADGRGLRDELGFLATRMPFYPMLLSLFVGFGHGVLAARALQWVAGSLVAALTFLLARRLTNARTAWLAGLGTAMDPFLIHFTSLLLTETLFTLALTWFFLVSATRLEVPRETTVRPPWVALGIIGALCTYLRESSLGLACVVLAWLVLYDTFHGNFAVQSRARRFVRSSCSTLCSVLIILACLVPWAWRNKSTVDSWVLLTTRSGISLYDGVGPQADGSSNLGDVKQMPAVLGLSETEWNRFFNRSAWAEIRQNPTRILELALIKLKRTWSIVPNADAYQSPLVRTIAAVWTVPMFTCAAWGGILWWKRERGVGVWTVVFLLLPALYLSALHSIFVGSVRYRIGALPMITILAAYGVVRVIDRLRNPRTVET